MLLIYDIVLKGYEREKEIQDTAVVCKEFTISTPEFPTPRRLRLEDCLEFEASLLYKSEFQASLSEL